MNSTTENFMTTVLEQTTFKNEYERTQFILTNYVLEDNHYLNFVKDEYKSYELYKNALKVNAEVLYNIPSKYANIDLLVTALNTNPHIYTNIPQDYVKFVSLLEPSVYTDMVKKCVTLFDKIPDLYRTEQLCEYVISVDPTMFHHLPEKYKNNKFAEMALLNSKKKSHQYNSKNLFDGFDNKKSTNGKQNIQVICNLFDLLETMTMNNTPKPKQTHPPKISVEEVPETNDGFNDMLTELFSKNPKC